MILACLDKAGSLIKANGNRELDKASAFDKAKRAKSPDEYSSRAW